MSHFSIYILLILTIIYACKSDVNKNQNKTDDKKEVKVTPETQKHFLNIQRAHNSKKFKVEKVVKFKLKLTIEKKVFYDNFINLKTDLSKLKINENQSVKLIEQNNLNNDYEKKMYFLSEIYAIAFIMNIDDFKKVSSKNDNFIKATFNSIETETDYEILSHPITDIIQQINYNTNINGKPFESGSVVFEKYITVNRIPVPLFWTFKNGEQVVAKAEISRISYPNTFL